MATSISGRVSVNFAVSKSYPAADKPATGGVTFNLSAMTDNQAIGSTETPPTSKMYYKQLSSTTTIDLTAAVSEDGETVNGTGLKVQFLFVRNNDTTNTAKVEDGAADAYQLQAGQYVLLQPDSGWTAMAFEDNLADIAAGAKNVKVTITAGTVDVCIVMG